MAKKNRIKIKLICKENKQHYYTTSKNKTNSKEKLKLKKYNPIIRKHVTYIESKIK